MGAAVEAWIRIDKIPCGLLKSTNVFTKHSLNGDMLMMLAWAFIVFAAVVVLVLSIVRLSRKGKKSNGRVVVGKDNNGIINTGYIEGGVTQSYRTVSTKSKGGMTWWERGWVLAAAIATVIGTVMIFLRDSA